MSSTTDSSGYFARRLRELRESAGLTQTQLAQRTRMHRQGIAKLELGEREPGWHTVQLLASALGVDCREFVNPNLEPPADEEPARPRGRPKKDASETSAEDMPLAQHKPRGRKTRRPRGG
jgi:transcriptional regulator with XRE-family HTH domain